MSRARTGKEAESRRPSERRPIAAQASPGIRLGARMIQSLKVGEAGVEALAWHPLGLVVTTQGRELVIPAARLDWVELEE